MNTWQHVKAWFHPDSAKGTSEEVVVARKRLAEEQRQLSESLERTLAAYDERVASLANRIRSLDDASLAREMALIRDAQIVLRRILRRLDIAERPTRELMDEWHDWETVGQISNGAPHPEKPVRQELLRSELTLRGIDLPRRAPETQEPVQEPSRPAAEVLPEERGYAEPAVMDDLPEWDEMLEATSAGGWSGLSKAHATQPEQMKHLAQLAAQLRAEQGALRLHDRHKGIRRHRVAVFE